MTSYYIGSTQSETNFQQGEGNKLAVLSDYDYPDLPDVFYKEIALLKTVPVFDWMVDFAPGPDSGLIIS